MRSAARRFASSALLLALCVAGQAVAQGSTTTSTPNAPAPSSPSLDVRAAAHEVPIQLQGDVHGFGLTPFQLRDMPAGHYVLLVRPGAFQVGVSRLDVERDARGTHFDVGSIRSGLLMRNALLPGLGHLRASNPFRAGSSLAQTTLAAAQTWDAHRDYNRASTRQLQAQQSYDQERDAENLNARRIALRDASAQSSDLRVQQQRWLAVTAWAWGSSLLDLYCDARPVAALVSSADGGQTLQVAAPQTSRALALLRGTIHPGSGHYALNHRWRGAAFELLSSVGVYACLRQQSEVDQAQRQFLNAQRDYRAATEDELGTRSAAMHAAFDTWNSKHDRLRTVLWTTGTVWGLNMLDVLFAEPVSSAPELAPVRRLGLSLGPQPGGAGGALLARF